MEGPQNNDGKSTEELELERPFYRGLKVGPQGRAVDCSGGEGRSGVLASPQKMGRSRPHSGRLVRVILKERAMEGAELDDPQRKSDEESTSWAVKGTLSWGQ